MLRRFIKNHRKQMVSVEEETCPQPPPRIKSAEPDLVISVDEGAASYKYYKVMMAHHSSYIDKALLDDPKLEIINFPDIQPGVFELMVSCLTPSNNMTVTDVYLVFPFYVKYEFHEGVKICDKRIQDEMERTDDFPLDNDNNNSNSQPPNAVDRRGISRFIETRIRYLADFMDYLPKTKVAGLVVIEAILQDRLARLFLTQQHFKLLLPIICKEERLLHPIRTILAQVGVTVTDIMLSEEHDTVNFIFQLLRLQFKLDYARYHGCTFPDEETSDPCNENQPTTGAPPESTDQTLNQITITSASSQSQTNVSPDEQPTSDTASAKRELFGERRPFKLFKSQRADGDKKATATPDSGSEPGDMKRESSQRASGYAKRSLKHILKTMPATAKSAFTIDEIAFDTDTAGTEQADSPTLANSVWETA